MRHFRDEVLKADEVSYGCRIPKSTIYKLCLEGQIPGTKIGRHWRFDRKDIEAWFKKELKRKTKIFIDCKQWFTRDFYDGCLSYARKSCL